MTQKFKEKWDHYDNGLKEGDFEVGVMFSPRELRLSKIPLVTSQQVTIPLVAFLQLPCNALSQFEKGARWPVDTVLPEETRKPVRPYCETIHLNRLVNQSFHELRESLFARSFSNRELP